MATRGTEATVPSGTGDTGRLSLWLAVASGTVAWGIHLVGSYALVPVACATGIAWILHAVTILTLIPTAYGTWYCFRVWKRYRGQVGPSPHGRSAEYQQYLGLVGALLNALYVFVIALEGLPVAIMNPCLGLQ